MRFIDIKSDNVLFLGPGTTEIEETRRNTVSHSSVAALPAQKFMGCFSFRIGNHSGGTQRSWRLYADICSLELAKVMH